MKKLKLNLRYVEEVLTREQLKHIVGGNGSGVGSGSYGFKCTYDGGWIRCWDYNPSGTNCVDFCFNNHNPCYGCFRVID